MVTAPTWRGEEGDDGNTPYDPLSLLAMLWLKTDKALTVVLSGGSATVIGVCVCVCVCGFEYVW